MTQTIGLRTSLRPCRDRYTTAWRARRSEARGQLQESGVVTDGWVVVGVSVAAGAVRGVVERESTYGLSPERVRLLRRYPDRPDLEGYTRAVGLVRRFEEDYPEGVGLEYSIWHVDDPSSPLAIDWLGMLRESRLTRPRRYRDRIDRSRLTNLGFVTRGPWRDLIY